jgi:hypothetical protein
MPLPVPQLQEALSASGAFLEKRRPPLDLRHLVDYRIDITNNDVVVVCNRPSTMEKGKILDLPLAKARWIGTRQRWRLFWMRASGKWETYDPMPEARTLREVLEEIDRDSHMAFFG